MNKLNEQLEELLYLSGLSDNKRAAAVLGISTKTLKRYRTGITRPPIIIIRFLTILSGDLSQIDESFEGWRIKDASLISPNNETFTHSRLEHVRMEYEMNRTNRADIKDLHEEIKNLKEMLPSAEVVQLRKSS